MAQPLDSHAGSFIHNFAPETVPPGCCHRNWSGSCLGAELRFSLTLGQRAGGGGSRAALNEWAPALPSRCPQGGGQRSGASHQGQEQEPIGLSPRGSLSALFKPSERHGSVNNKITLKKHPPTQAQAPGHTCLLPPLCSPAPSFLGPAPQWAQLPPRTLGGSAHSGAAGDTLHPAFPHLLAKLSEQERVLARASGLPETRSQGAFLS